MNSILHLGFLTPQKRDKLRAYHQIKGLSKQFEIHLISISDQKINSQELKELESHCKTIKTSSPIWKRGLNCLNILKQ